MAPGRGDILSHHHHCPVLLTSHPETPSPALGKLVHAIRLEVVQAGSTMQAGSILRLCSKRSGRKWHMGVVLHRLPSFCPFIPCTAPLAEGDAADPGHLHGKLIPRVPNSFAPCTRDFRRCQGRSCSHTMRQDGDNHPVLLPQPGTSKPAQTPVPGGENGPHKELGAEA